MSFLNGEWKRKTENGKRKTEAVVCLSVWVLFRMCILYFIDYNTKRDYQTSNGITKRSKKVASKQGLSLIEAASLHLCTVVHTASITNPTRCLSKVSPFSNWDKQLHWFCLPKLFLNYWGSFTWKCLSYLIRKVTQFWVYKKGVTNIRSLFEYPHDFWKSQNNLYFIK